MSVDKVRGCVDRFPDQIGLARALQGLEPGTVQADPVRFAIAALRVTIDPDPEDVEAFLEMLPAD